MSTLLLPDAHICSVPHGGTLVVPHDGTRWAVIPAGDFRCSCRDARTRRIKTYGALVVDRQKCVHMRAMRRLREASALPTDHPADCPHCASLRAAAQLFARPEAPKQEQPTESIDDLFARFER